MSNILPLLPQLGGWVPWPAKYYNQQVNPQVTGEDGYFAFFTPAGLYYLQVDGSPGYQSWRSPVVQVITEIVHVNVPYTPLSLDTMAQVALTPEGPEPAVVMVPVGGSVEWRAALGNTASVTELVRFTDNPFLQPRTWGALDPLSSTLGFDSGMLAPGQSHRRRFTQLGTYTYADGAGHTGQIVVAHAVYLPAIIRQP